jgi:hypothetical protein
MSATSALKDRLRTTQAPTAEYAVDTTCRAISLEEAFLRATYCQPAPHAVNRIDLERWAKVRFQLLRQVDAAAMRHAESPARGVYERLTQLLADEDSELGRLLRAPLPPAVPTSFSRDIDTQTHLLFRAAFVASPPATVRWLADAEAHLMLFRVKAVNHAADAASKQNQASLLATKLRFLQLRGFSWRPVNDEDWDRFGTFLAAQIEGATTTLPPHVPDKHGELLPLLPRGLNPNDARALAEQNPDVTLIAIDSAEAIMPRLRHMNSRAHWTRLGGRAFRPLSSLDDFLPVACSLHVRNSIADAAPLHARLLATTGFPELMDLVAALEAGAVADYSAAAASTEATGTVDASSAEALRRHALRDFPLCSRYLYDALTRNHHLKHSGRQQLTLFLKDIGVPIEDTTTRLRQEFGRGGISADKFEKDYAYNIRHAYGRAGGCKNYTAWSCVQCVARMPGAGEFHGCPFRHLSGLPEEGRSPSQTSPMLVSRLREYYGLPLPVAESIAQIAAEGHYQRACARTFEATHQGTSNGSEAAMAPTAYVRHSLLHYNAPKDIEDTVRTS